MIAASLTSEANEQASEDFNLCVLGSIRVTVRLVPVGYFWNVA